MDLGIEGLRAVVTGGASGIGLAIARRLAAEGARVHVCDRSGEAIGRLAASDPAIAAGLCDVADRASVADYLRQAVGHLGGLDCLVNNAGIAGPTARVEDCAPDQWDATLAINITGQFNFTRLAVAHLRLSRNASILNLSSAAGRLGFALRTPYAASKWAVVGFTKSLAAELGPIGIRANAMLPGLVDGARIKGVFAAKAAALGIEAEPYEAQALGAVSMRTLVTPEQIADMAVYLASPRAATISGQAISVCGDLQMLV
jgi:NAD(P)-dependent dehydrogenase (short-subunit alcohol dehydrogenase family)